MAIQARLYQDNLGFGLGLPLGASQDFAGDNGNGFNLQNQNQQQRAFGYNGVLGSELSVNDLYLDEYVRLQNERLRAAMEAQRKQQLAAVVNEIELRALVLVAHKDREIALAAKRTAELEKLVAKLEMENHIWQRAARENEATVVSLNNTLEQLLAEDAGSCCGGETESRVRCRSCGSGEACMVMLPCRHLCSCQACDAFLDSCPVCQTLKKASIEALIF